MNDESLIGLVRSNPQLTDLLELFNAVKAAENPSPFAYLASPGTAVTLFAPSNKAFAKIPAATRKEWLSKPLFLIELLEQHVAGGELLTDRLKPSQIIQSHTTTPTQTATSVLETRYLSGVVRYGSSNVTTKDILASNGVLQIIDDIQQPSADNCVRSSSCSLFEIMQATPQLSKLVGLFQKANIFPTSSTSREADTDTPVTIFAPSNDAVGWHDWANVDNQEVLAIMLEYHLVRQVLVSTELRASQTVQPMNADGMGVVLTRSPSSVIRFGNATLTRKDVFARNGVLHVIDLLAAPKRSLYQVILARPELSKVATLIESATNDNGVGLADLLDNDGLVFTLFAPDNTAIPDKESNQWLGAHNRQELVWVLYSHMVADLVTSVSLGASQMIQTRAGVGVLVTRSAAACKFGGATITDANIVASNGVLHVMSGLALTPQPTLFGRIQANPQLQTFTRLLLVAGLADDINNFNDGKIDPLAEDDDNNKPAHWPPNIADDDNDAKHTRSWTGTVQTIFAPTDAAFGALTSAKLKILEDPFNRVELVRLLRYHLLKGNYATSSWLLEGLPLQVSTEAVELTPSNKIIAVPVTISRASSGKVGRVRLSIASFYSSFYFLLQFLIRTLCPLHTLPDHLWRRKFNHDRFYR
jgi:uncharacterized surface protein with fasciclin (FAS1) repeats